MSEHVCCGRSFTGRSWGGHRRYHAKLLTRDDGARFWAKVDRSAGPDACWPWTGSRTRLGYGRFRVRGATETASRFAWALVNGPIPEGGYICHHCDNPPCCNPAHLFLGTAGDNVRDMHAKGRHVVVNRVRGERHPEARLTDSAVQSIRELHASGRSKRSLAFQFGVARSTVQAAISGHTWSHVA